MMGLSYDALERKRNAIKKSEEILLKKYPHIFDCGCGCHCSDEGDNVLCMSCSCGINARHQKEMSAKYGVNS